MRKSIFLFLLVITAVVPSLTFAGNYTGKVVDMKSSAYTVSEILFTPSSNPVVFYSASDLSGYKVINERFYFVKDEVTSKVYTGYKGLGGYFSQDGKRMVFNYQSSKDDKIYVYDNGRILGPYNVIGKNYFQSIVVSQDGKNIAIILSGKVIINGKSISSDLENIVGGMSWFGDDGNLYRTAYNPSKRKYVLANVTNGTTLKEASTVTDLGQQEQKNYFYGKNDGNTTNWISDSTCKQQEKAIKSTSGLVFIKSCNMNQLSIYKNGVLTSEIKGVYNQGSAGPWIGISQNKESYAFSFAVKDKLYVSFNGDIYKQDSSNWGNSKYAMSNDGKNIAYTSNVDGKTVLTINNNRTDTCDYIKFSFSPDSKYIYYTCTNSKWENQKSIYTRNQLITIDLTTAESKKITSEGLKNIATIAKENSSTGTTTGSINQFDASKLTQKDIDRITLEQNVGTEYRLYKANKKTKAEFLEAIAQDFGGTGSYAYQFAQTLSFSK